MTKISHKQVKAFPEIPNSVINTLTSLSKQEILFSKSFTNVYHFSYSTKGWTYQRDVMGYSEGCVI